MKTPVTNDHNEVFGSVAVVDLLMLTAWGNVLVIAIVSFVGLIANLILLNRTLSWPLPRHRSGLHCRRSHRHRSAPLELKGKFPALPGKIRAAIIPYPL